MRATTRAELVHLTPLGARVAELGVAKGDFSFEMYQQRRDITLTLIDKWDDHHDEAEAHFVMRRFAGIDADVRRMTFAQAVKDYPNGYFDLIYIDGYAHTGQDEGQTLVDWWPKLKQGGIFAGHDYCPRNWPLTCMEVDNFVKLHNLELLITGEQSDTEKLIYPSWYIRKP